MVAFKQHYYEIIYGRISRLRLSLLAYSGDLTEIIDNYWDEVCREFVEQADAEGRSLGV